MSGREAVLEVSGLSVSAPAAKSRIVESASFTVHAGECLGIVGESGAGKSLMTLSSVGLQPRTLSVTGRSLWRGRDILSMRGDERQALYGREILLIIQQAMEAFDPLVRIGRQLVETVRCVHPSSSRERAFEEACEALAALRFEDPARIMDAFPCELSGGQLQRCMLSTARLLKPSLIIADEPTSALDVLSGGQVVEEFSRLQTDLHAALILITHDLAVVQRLADRLIVMQRGRIVESGGAEVLVRPSHPYTQYLAGTRVALSNRFMRAAGRGDVR